MRTRPQTTALDLVGVVAEKRELPGRKWSEKVGKG
jgi:hypothetical protein